MKIKNIEFLIIPYNVLKDNSLSENEKKVLSNVIGVVNQGGTFKFHNSWIADYLGCHKNSVSRIISSLKNKGLVNVEIKTNPETKQVISRVLTLTDRGINTYVNRGITNDVDRGINSSVKYNKITTNNINNKTTKFDEWWELYGKKVGRKDALKKWLKIDEALYGAIFNHTRKYIKTKPEVQYRLNPTTYINGEHWNDEVLETKEVNEQKIIDINQEKVKQKEEEYRDYVRRNRENSASPEEVRDILSRFKRR